MYPHSFELAVQHDMLYEVGGHWNINAIGTKDGTNAHACGYTNDPSDRGGETKYGIAKNSNPHLDITHMDWEGAKAVYYANYWLNGKCDKMNGRLAALHFDSAIQHGSNTAAKFIQRAIGVNDDGELGPISLTSLNSKDPISICNLICDQREKYYTNIASNDSTQLIYLKGWLRRVNEMRVFVTDPTRNF